MDNEDGFFVLISLGSCNKTLWPGCLKQREFISHRSPDRVLSGESAPPFPFSSIMPGTGLDGP